MESLNLYKRSPIPPERREGGAERGEGKRHGGTSSDEKLLPKTFVTGSAGETVKIKGKSALRKEPSIGRG